MRLVVCCLVDDVRYLLRAASCSLCFCLVLFVVGIGCLVFRACRSGLLVYRLSVRFLLSVVCSSLCVDC